ncbi:hypothetical protein [Arthrobacter sp. ISL-5]|uniref:hypothetical protein n=1 Tax=Arthrobacter sp. ISL-5 TaxID=2819111 RepID=UPI001BEC0682|nr:hypothetical protein [Arthrobacter sp. ISL-5]MBT2555288.1 hypothetical protein [Arthrobacter sp. ISL-5]
MSPIPRVRAESDDAVATGYAAKVSIHPAQMPVIRESFTPGPAEVERAQRMLTAAQQSDRGVFTFEGAMEDEPVLRHARKTLARAGLAFHVHLGLTLSCTQSVGWLYLLLAG